MTEQVEAADVLVAGTLPAAAVVGPAPSLQFVAVDGVGLDARADMGRRLLGEAAITGGEGLPLPLRAVRRLGVGDAGDPVHRLVGGQEVADLRLEGHREWVLDDRCLEGAVGRRSIVEDDRSAQGGGRGPGDADRLGGDPVDLDRVEPMGRGEAPGPVDEDTDAEPLALAGGDAFDPSGFHRDRLVESTGRCGRRHSSPRGSWPCRWLGS